MARRDPIPTHVRLAIAEIERTACERALTAKELARHESLALTAEAYRATADKCERLSLAILAIEGARLACALLSTIGAAIVAAVFLGA